jgi:transcriptional regulator with XRE-family HTH domain
MSKKVQMEGKKYILGQQCRAARALLGWSRDQLAKASDVGPRTLMDFERGTRQPHRRTISDVRRALEEAGVTFIDGNGEGPGVRLKKWPSAS